MFLAERGATDMQEIIRGALEVLVMFYFLTRVGNT